MKLGNSNGNNTGKKYFIRGKDDQHEPTPQNRKKADEFNNWFALHHKILANFLKSKSTYDEDVFNTTFMRISEKILFAGPVIKDYRAYFHRSYFTNYVQDREKESRYCPMPTYDHRSEAHHVDAKEQERAEYRLENDIFDYVYKNYELREFELFKMYISLKPAVNYQTLSEITHVKAHNIQRIISKILVDVRRNKDFVNRYREIR